jgi:hypothetical protein
MAGLGSQQAIDLRKHIEKFWHAYGCDLPSESANTAATKKKENWVEKHCTYCEIHAPKISKTHDTDYCRKTKESGNLVDDNKDAVEN